MRSNEGFGIIGAPIEMLRRTLVTSPEPDIRMELMPMPDSSPSSGGPAIQNPNAWHEAMKAAYYYLFSDAERTELHVWEMANLDGTKGMAGDWPGWAERIGPCPWSEEVAPGMRRVELGALMDLDRIYRDEQADGFVGTDLRDTGRSSGTKMRKEHREEKRWAIFERDDFRCLRCGTRRRLTIDHVVARINGGGDGMCNWQTLCHRCNSRKGRKA